MKKIFIIAGDFKNGKDGPSIGVKNLVSGLEKIGIRYTAVRSYNIFELIKLLKIFSYKYVYMNSIVNYNIIYYLAKLFPNKKFVIGPNFFPHKKIIGLKNCLYLSPCSWHYRYLKETYSFDSLLEILKFPVPYSLLSEEINCKNKKNTVVVYFKNLYETNETEETTQRKNSIVKQIIEYLNIEGKEILYVEYGSYKYDDWIAALKKSSIAIMITGTETQCIAKYEAMALNVPILNYQQNTRKWKESGVLIDYGSTLPDIEENIYGKDFYSFEDFLLTYKYLKKNNNSITSRIFIKNNFIPHTIAKKFISLFKLI